MSDPNSEGFGNVPNSSANFGSIPHGAETFRTFRNGAERTDQHTLTVREVARLFEEAGVPRTERSIINWCQPNRQGISRLDSFFDTNERKYFITGQSVHLAIKEEQAKAANNAPVPQTETPQPKSAEPRVESSEAHSSPDEVQDLRRKVMDLEITNRVKEELLRRAQTQLDQADEERKTYIERLIAGSRKIGELETHLLQLGSGDTRPALHLPHSSEHIGSESHFTQVHTAEATRETAAEVRPFQQL